MRTTIEQFGTISPADPDMECGGLPPLSPKLNVQQQNDPGEACLARLNHQAVPGFAAEVGFERIAPGPALRDRAAVAVEFGSEFVAAACFLGGRL
jgi:hypothetical protein